MYHFLYKGSREQHILKKKKKHKKLYINIFIMQTHLFLFLFAFLLKAASSASLPSYLETGFVGAGNEKSKEKFNSFLESVVDKRRSFGTIVTSLPGYEGSLPFALETGYVGVGSDESKQIFYYFVESQGNRSKDPILYWVGGGPSLSGLTAFFYAHGPLSFDLSYPFDGSLPKLIDNNNAWTKFMNILYLDAPAGTGFSYSTTNEYDTSNLKMADDLNDFIHKWIETHERFSTNDIYISGDGYAGNPIPIALKSILDNNTAGVTPYVNMKGYVLIGPGANFSTDFNGRYPYANRLGFIPDDLFQRANETCGGSFWTPPDDACEEVMKKVNGLIKDINTAHILDLSCGGDAQLLPPGQGAPDPDCAPSNRLRCRGCDFRIVEEWANDVAVQIALGVRLGTTPSPWRRYNETLDKISFDKDDVKDKNIVPYHQELSKDNLNTLVLCGDHDMDIPCLATEHWIDYLDLPLEQEWRVWSYDINETYGFTKKFKNGDFSLTFATVKGGGHFVPYYRPFESLTMLYNWTKGVDI